MTASVALFDFDGTILRRDSTAVLVRQLLRRRPWRAPLIAPAVVRLRRARDPASLQAAKCDILGTLLRGLTAVAVAEACDRAAERLRPERRPEVMEAIAACTARGGRAVVVSASPGVLVRRALDDARVEVVATEFTVEAGRFTGAVRGPVCFGEAKVEAIRSHLGAGAEITDAWSDSLLDRPMMQLARVRHWLCPPADAEAVHRVDPSGVVVVPAGARP